LPGRSHGWAFVVFSVLSIVDASVTLFNRPKLVVPPAASDEPGAIALRWRSRRYRRRRRGGGADAPARYP